MQLPLTETLVDYDHHMTLAMFGVNSIKINETHFLTVGGQNYYSPYPSVQMFEVGQGFRLVAEDSTYRGNCLVLLSGNRVLKLGGTW